jgi:soluble lytic murein transglycosylase
MRAFLAAGLVAAGLGLARAEGPAPFVFPDAPFAGAGEGAIELMGLERWDEARAALTAFAASKDAPADAAGRARLAYVTALCDRRLGHWADAAAGFDAAADGLPLLVDYARYYAAEAYENAGDLARARERVDAVGPDAVLHAEARLLAGDLLRAAQKWDEVATHYAAYLASYPKGIRVAEALFYTAEAEERLGHAGAAMARYRQLEIEQPLSSWAERARPRLDALIAALPKKKRAAARELRTAERIARGHVYFDAMRNELAEADFAAALQDRTLERTQRCDAAYHLAQTVFKERQRPRAAPLFDDAVLACEHLPSTDLLVRALYQGGRSWGSAGDAQKAIARFERVQGFGDHSFADDAAVRASEQWASLEDKGDPAAGAEVEKILAAVPTRFPDGDMKGEALWRLAWRAWRAQRYEDAVRWLDAEIAAVPHEQSYFAEGQTHYWKGRAFEKLGRKDDARAAYARAVREYPLSYYALLALNRLHEGYPADYAALVAELKTAGAPRPWSFAPRAVFAEPGYQRAVELLRLGQGEAAERELAHIGLRVPDGRREVTDPDQAELLWATALLYDRAQRFDKSHWIARWSVRDHERAWPNGDNRGKWEIAYPRGYWHLLVPAAKEQGVPADLLVAFVREESAFDPIMESFANAIGLTQMILPTATRFGKGLGFPISRETLRDPEKNVAVGSRWLGFLWTTFHQHLGLVIAGYNSGEGAVWRWLCERGTWDYDEFGEAIPFDETRNYTKRVLSSDFVYSFLSDGTIPVVPNAIPGDAINAKRCKTAAISAPASASGQRTIASPAAPPPPRPR